MEKGGGERGREEKGRGYDPRRCSLCIIAACESCVVVAINRTKQPALGI